MSTIFVRPAEGNILYRYPASKEEIDSLHDEVRDEEMRLQRLLEYNHAMLIRSGIAQKYSNGNQRHNALSEAYYKTTSFQHRPEVRPETQFQVAHWWDSDPNHPTDRPAVGIAMQFRNTTTIKMGSRAIEDGQVVSVSPNPDPVFGFTEEDVLFAGSLLDTIHREVETGSLPHLRLNSTTLNELTVFGSQAPAT